MDKTAHIKESLQYKEDIHGFINVITPKRNIIINTNDKLILNELSKGTDFHNICTALSNVLNKSFEFSKKYLYDTLSYLKDAEILDFNNEFFNECITIDKDIVVCGEKDYVSVSNFINENLKDTTVTLFSDSKNEKRYNTYLIRALGFSNAENYFFSFKKNSNRISCVIGIQFISSDNSTVEICLIQLNDEFEKLLSLYNEIEKKLIMLKKKQIKITIKECNKTGELLNFLNSVGFNADFYTPLKDDLNNCYIYAKTLEENQDD